MHQDIWSTFGKGSFWRGPIPQHSKSFVAFCGNLLPEVLHFKPVKPIIGRWAVSKGFKRCQTIPPCSSRERIAPGALERPALRSTVQHSILFGGQLTVFCNTSSALGASRNCQTAPLAAAPLAIKWFSANSRLLGNSALNEQSARLRVSPAIWPGNGKPTFFKTRNLFKRAIEHREKWMVEMVMEKRAQRAHTSTIHHHLIPKNAFRICLQA